MLKLLIKTDNQYLRELYEVKKNFEEDSGTDLYCPCDIVIPAKTQAKLDFQIQCALLCNSTTFEPYLLLPRSSIVKTPLRMSNSIGLIDKGYRGNIMAFVDNISNEEYKINKGDRLFQIVHPSLQPLKVELVDYLHSSKREGGGFGSTGK